MSAETKTLLSGTTKLIWLCVAAAAALGIWLCCCRALLAGQKDKPRIIKPYVTLSGAHSRITKRSYFRVTTPKAWTALWLRHVGSKGDGYDVPEVAEVNFGKCMVVAIFHGKGWNTRGIQAVSITEEENQIRFRFEGQYYQTGPEGHSVTAYGLFVIPRSSKLLILEENVQGIIGAPPVWKERARFGKLHLPQPLIAAP